MKQYILKDGVPVEEPDRDQWVRWMAMGIRNAGKDTVGDTLISTIFLGLNHAFDGGDPILWETMVFGGALDLKTDRCAGTREQAVAMHVRMVERVKNEPK